MAEENLVVLSKFDRRDILEPTEQSCFCYLHYQERKNDFKDYQIDMIKSSIPKIWCEICTPPEWN